MDNEATNNAGNPINNESVTVPTPAPAAAPVPVAPSDVKIVGVRFKRAGRIYYFDPKDFQFKIDDWVVVETARGMEVGRVVIAPSQVLTSEVELPLKPVIRKAEPGEIQNTRDTEQKEREALTECAAMINRLKLPMKLLAAEYSLDASHLTFFFSSAERVDFRELVRELATNFKVRVELRQVGARDEAKIIGGYGRCGRQLCCCSYLSEFVPISIKMAKEQGLPLNPMKISGVCGRLLCCLAYEHDTYHEMRSKMPREGQLVSTPMGRARVVGNNPLKGTSVVELETQVTVEMPVSDLKIETGTFHIKSDPNKEEKEAEKLDQKDKLSQMT